MFRTNVRVEFAIECDLIPEAFRADGSLTPDVAAALIERLSDAVAGYAYPVACYMYLPNHTKRLELDI